MPSTPLRMICISVLLFGNVVNKFNDILSIFKQVVIFPEYSDLFRIVKTNMDTLRPTFLDFQYEGKSLSASLQHRQPTSYLDKEIIRRKKSNFGRRIFVFKGVLDVSRTTKILRRPGPKCHSMSRGRRRFYVSRHVESSSATKHFLSVLRPETRQWWRTFRNRRNSKPANRTSDQR